MWGEGLGELRLEEQGTPQAPPGEARETRVQISPSAADEPGQVSSIFLGLNFPICKVDREGHSGTEVPAGWGCSGLSAKAQGL